MSKEITYPTGTVHRSSTIAIQLGRTQAAGDPTAEEGGQSKRYPRVRERIVTLDRPFSRGRGAAADTCARPRRELGQGVLDY